MDIIWIGVLVVFTLWAIFYFRSKLKAHKAFVTLDLVEPWFQERGLIDDTVRFTKYEGAPAVKYPNAALIVGMGKTEAGESLGFAIEVSSHGDILKAIVLEPSLASHHKSAFMGSTQSGVPIIDLLEEKSIQMAPSTTVSAPESRQVS